MMEIAILSFLTFIFIYGYFGYPLFLFVLDSLFHPGSKHKKYTPCNGFSVLISVKNEAVNIVNKLNNLFSLNMVDFEIEVIVVSDGSDDITITLLNKYPSSNLRVIESRVNNGKPISLNTAIGLCKFDTILFADSRQSFDSQVIVELLDELKSNDVSCVSGQLFPKQSNKGVGTGVDLYWKIEKFIRRVESDLFSSIGCTGAIYAIKGPSYHPIPSDTLLDDVVIPMKVLVNGRKVKFRSTAMAYDFQKLDRKIETKRKARTIGGNFQMLFRYPEFLIARPFIIGFLYFSHKISRLISPFALLAIFALMVQILPSMLWKFVFILGVPTLFFSLRIFNSKLFSKGSAFLFLNYMVFKGLFYYLRGSYKKGW